MNKIAYKITLDNVKIKEEFLEFLLLSIKTIHFIFEDNDVITASKEEDVETTFIKLKQKVSDWMNDSMHVQPFYPRSFIKKILKKSMIINFINRDDNPDKMRPDDYLLNDKNKMKNFLLKRIDKDDENSGLKFKINQMSSDSLMPLDVYNAIVFNYNLNKNTRMYIKFKISKEFTDAYFTMNFISIHDDNNQNIK